MAMLDFYALNSCKITQIIYTSFYSKIGIILFIDENFAYNYILFLLYFLMRKFKSELVLLFSTFI